MSHISLHHLTGVRIAIWRALGTLLRSVRSEEHHLLEAIRHDPQGSEAYRVYADWLMSQHDPFGEVISTWLTAEAAPSALETQKLSDAAMALADGLPEVRSRLVGTTHRWHRGFVTSVSANLQNFDLRHFLEGRVAKCVRKLQLRGNAELLNESIGMLSAAAPASVDEVRFEQRDLSIEDEVPALVGLMALPQLRSLGLSQGRYDFSGLSFDQLHHLDVRCTGQIESLHHAWARGFGPQLRSLEAYDVPLSADALLKPLERGQFDKLLSLALAVSEADEVIKRLTQNPALIKNLTSLSVLGPVSEVGFGYLLAKPELFQGIARLEISRRRVRSTFFQKQVLPVFPQLKANAVTWGARKYPYQHRALQRVPSLE